MRKLRLAVLVLSALMLASVTAGAPPALAQAAPRLWSASAARPTSIRRTPRTSRRWRSTPPGRTSWPPASNDLVDMQPCSRQASTTAAACSFPLGTFNLGVGLGGVYFSFDRGHTWTQPTYTRADRGRLQPDR